MSISASSPSSLSPWLLGLKDKTMRSSYLSMGFLLLLYPGTLKSAGYFPRFLGTSSHPRIVSPFQLCISILNNFVFAFLSRFCGITLNFGSILSRALKDSFQNESKSSIASVVAGIFSGSIPTTFEAA